MEIKNVPQDGISTFAGGRKAMYATDDEGKYGVVASSGWEVEEEATKQALHELERLADEAYEAVREGQMSPLYYHMYAQRMDLIVLSQSVGMFQWRIKRHFKPSVFNRLSDTLLGRYSEALGLSVDALKQLPEKESV
ncbi:hypothetical protein [Sulfurimonas sp. HSL3-7]|uniref:hypothetical protein n=1 Tax=Sulfonitrofixus jiaomeiensis TaxID=3131938 RepID=UPI0031FA1A7A